MQRFRTCNTPMILLQLVATPQGKCLSLHYVCEQDETQIEEVVGLIQVTRDSVMSCWPTLFPPEHRIWRAQLLAERETEQSYYLTYVITTSSFCRVLSYMQTITWGTFWKAFTSSKTLTTSRCAREKWHILYVNSAFTVTQCFQILSRNLWLGPSLFSISLATPKEHNNNNSYYYNVHPKNSFEIVK